jgi:hypothetical protein
VFGLRPAIDTDDWTRFPMSLWNFLANKPVNTSYVAAFGIMFLVSATLL